MDYIVSQFQPSSAQSQLTAWLFGLSLTFMLMFSSLVSSPVHADSWFDFSSETKEVLVPLPPEGEAARDQWYIFKQALKLRGYPLLDKLPPELGQLSLQPQDTVVFAGNLRLLSNSEQQRLLQWINQGGHLILALPPHQTKPKTVTTPWLLQQFGVDTQYQADNTTPGCINVRNDAAALAQLRQRTQLREARYENPSTAAEIAKRFPEVSELFCASPRMVLSEKVEPAEYWVVIKSEDETTTEPATTADQEERSDEAVQPAGTQTAALTTEIDRTAQGDPADNVADSEPVEEDSETKVAPNAEATPDEYIYVRFEHGKGTIDLVSDLDFLDNDSLELPSSQSLLEYLLSPHRTQGRLILIPQIDAASIWSRLLFEGWPIWLPLLLALLGGLWRYSQRLGTALPASQPERRSLIEHVQAAGEHLYRQNTQQALHAALLQRLWQQIHWRFPQLQSEPLGTQAQVLSEATGIAPAAIEQAMSEVTSKQGQVFLDQMATLSQLLQTLGSADRAVAA